MEDFWINKAEIHRAFRTPDGADYGSRSNVKLTGRMGLSIYKEDIEEFFKDCKWNFDKQTITAVCAGVSEREYLEQGEGFNKQNIKLVVTKANNELSISGTLYLLEDDFESLIKNVATLSNINTHPSLKIDVLESSVTSSSSALVQGYCEGISTLVTIAGPR